MGFLPFGLNAQIDGFYINQKYGQHLESDRTTGRSEVAFFAIFIEKKDTCLSLRQYQRIDSTRHIYTQHYLEEQYSWRAELSKYVAPCQRKPSQGLLRHQHTEGQNWLTFQEEEQSVILKRCGWIKAENQFIPADSLRFFQKE
jgi:hypothetical protein